MARSDAMVQIDQDQGRQWQRILDEFEVRFLALDLELDHKLVEFFQTQPEWVVDCMDEESVLFVRAVGA